MSRPFPTATSDRLMTTEEAAEILCVSHSWLKKAAQRREVPCTHIGRAVRFSRTHLEEIIAAGEKPPIQAQQRTSARTRL
jgi:excisionase family DNA binding protein